jgi:hypothetical protein
MLSRWDRAKQIAVLHMGIPWSQECHHLDSHSYKQRDTPAHGTVGFPTGTAAGIRGCQGRVAAVLYQPGAGLGADRLKFTSQLKIAMFLIPRLCRTEYWVLRD